MQHDIGKTTQDHDVWLLSEYLAEVGSEMITHRKIKRNLKEEQQKIQSVCIPSLVEIKGEEKSKKENISITVKEMKKQIEEHHEKIVAKFNEWKEEAILALEREETIASNVIDNIIDDTDKQIVQLNRRCIEIDETLTLRNTELEEKMCKMLHEKTPQPIKSSYHLSEFRPGNMENEKIQVIFGKLPTINLL